MEIVQDVASLLCSCLDVRHLCVSEFTHARLLHQLLRSIYRRYYLLIHHITTPCPAFPLAAFAVHSCSLIAVSLVTTFGTLSGLTFTRTQLFQSQTMRHLSVVTACWLLTSSLCCCNEAAGSPECPSEVISLESTSAPTTITLKAGNSYSLGPGEFRLANTVEVPAGAALW
jgi:hypothetical protein